jgi:hypothetical protein
MEVIVSYVEIKKRVLDAFVNEASNARDEKAAVPFLPTGAAAWFVVRLLS